MEYVLWSRAKQGMCSDRVRLDRYLSVVEAGWDFDELLEGRGGFRVHSAFARALNLTDGKVFLTLLPLGRGCGASFAAVALGARESFLAWDARPGLAVERLSDTSVRLGSCAVLDFGRAIPWESPLTGLRATSASEANLCLLRRALLERPAASPFRSVLEGGSAELAAAVDRVRERVLERDGPGLEEAIAGVLGLGPGLTPSGDDVILGISLARAIVRRSEGLAGGLFEACVARSLSRTHALSAFFIGRALKGQGHEFVESALASLLADGTDDAGEAVGRLLGIGATSGFDMGLGLYLALEWQRRYCWCSSAW